MFKAYWADARHAALTAGEGELSAYRLERLSAIRNEAARRQGTAAELLLIRAARELCPGLAAPLDIAADENGKPFLRGGELCFSLSHSGELAMCAVSDMPIGADIQVLRPYNERLAVRFFAPEEREHILTSGDKDSAFTRVWALKESYIKAVGLGLKLPLASFSAVSHIPGWRLRAYPVAGGWAAVCASGDAGPEIFEKTEL